MESRRRPVLGLDVQLESHRRRVRPGAVRRSRPIPGPGAGIRKGRGFSVAIGPAGDREPARRPARGRIDRRGRMQPLRAGRLSGGVSCRFDPKSGFFALGQPHQFVPPPSGWTVIVPPIPPPAAAEAGGEAQAAPPSPLKPLFYDNDFRYLDRPDNPFHDPFDFLKRISPAPAGTSRSTSAASSAGKGGARTTAGSRASRTTSTCSASGSTWTRGIGTASAPSSRSSGPTPRGRTPPPSSSTSTTATCSTPSARPSSSRSTTGPSRPGSARVSNCCSATSGWSRRWTGRTVPGPSTTWRTGSIGARRWTSTSSGPGPTRSCA